MKTTKILTFIAAIGVLATSFAFVSAKGSSKNVTERKSTLKTEEPVGGFIMEDRN